MAVMTGSSSSKQSFNRKVAMESRVKDLVSDSCISQRMSSDVAG